MADIVNKAQTEVIVDGEQAEQQLSVLEQRADNYRKAMIEANKAGDVKAFKKAEDSLKKTNSQLRQIVRSSFDVNKVMNNLSISGPDDLKKALRAVNKELNSPSVVRGSKKYDELNAKLRLLRSEMAKVRAEQELGTKSTNKYFSAIQVFLGGLMAKGAIFLTGALGSTISTIRDFEKANVVLAGILGTNITEIKDLTSGAIALGKTSKYTASQVTELQTELAKLGFEKYEIKESQKHILNFATALNSNLGDAATLAGAALRAFGEDTTQTERFVSAMTMATNKSALSFESLTTAMPIVSPIAKAFNFSLEDTLALLGNLSDSGFTASSSATALRNILLNLADSNGKLAQELGSPIRNLDDLVIGFKRLEDKGIDLAGALELTDKQSVAAFQTFMEGADKLIPLRDGLIDVGDELERVANDQMNNLDGAVLTLQSSWEALMLSFSGSSGVLKTLVDWLTEAVVEVNKFIDATKLLQDRSYYGEYLDTEYNKSKEVQQNVIQKRKSEGYSADMSYKIQLQRTKLDLEDKKKEAEDAKKALDEFEASKSWTDQLIPGYGMKQSMNSMAIKRAYEVAQYEYDRLEMQKKAIQDLRSSELGAEAKTKFNAMNRDELSTWIKDEQNAADEFIGIAKSVLKEKNSLDSLTKKKGGGSTTKTNVAVEQRSKVLNKLEAMELEHNADMNGIKEKYLAGEISTESERNAEMLRLQIKFDKDREEVLQEFLKRGMISSPEVRAEIDKQLVRLNQSTLDREIKRQDDLKKILLSADPVRAEKEAYENRLRELDLYGIQRENLTKEQLSVLELLEKQHNERMSKIVSPDVRVRMGVLDEGQSGEAVALAKLREQNLISERQYRDQLILLDIAYTAKKLELEGLTEEQRIRLQQQSYEKQRRLYDENANLKDKLPNNQRLENLEQARAAELEFINKAFGENLQSTEAYEQARLAIIEKYNLLEEEQNIEKQARMLDVANFALDSLNTLMSSYSSFITAANDAEVASVNKKYDAQIKAAGRNQKKISKIEEARDKELKEVQRAGEERSFKVQIAMALASTAQSAINAYASAAAIPVVGHIMAPIAASVATAAGLLNVATIRKQHEAAMSNYWKGGYTPKGYKYGYAGNVHFGEFVANQDTVNNPEANAMLQVIDNAQRSNTSSSLKSSDFSRVLEYNETVAGMPMRSQSKAGMIEAGGQLVQHQDTLLRVAKVIEKLGERLEYPIEARTYYKGDGGIENMLKKEDRLRKNIHRNG